MMIIRILSGQTGGLIDLLLNAITAHAQEAAEGEKREKEPFIHECNAELKMLKGVDTAKRESQCLVVHLRSKAPRVKNSIQNREAYIVLVQENRHQYRMNLGLCCYSVDLSNTISHPRRLEGGCKYATDFDLVMDFFKEILVKHYCIFAVYESEQRFQTQLGFGAERRRPQGLSPKISHQ